MDDIQDPVSPAFKPSYGKPQDCNEGPDQARRNLLEDFNQGKESVPDNAMRNKIHKLGNPYSIGVQEKPISDLKPEEQPVKYLSPDVAAPFFAAVLVVATCQLNF